MNGRPPCLLAREGRGGSHGGRAALRSQAVPDQAWHARADRGGKRKAAWSHRYVAVTLPLHCRYMAATLPSRENTAWSSYRAPTACAAAPAPWPHPDRTAPRPAAWVSCAWLASGLRLACV